MAKTIRMKRLRELRDNVRALVLMVRRFAPELARHLLERLSLGDRMRTRKVAIGASAVGVAAVGAVAARQARHRGLFGDDDPQIDRT
jgi:hypothetical protein